MEIRQRSLEKGRRSSSSRSGTHIRFWLRTTKYAKEDQVDGMQHEVLQDVLQRIWKKWDLAMEELNQLGHVFNQTTQTVLTCSSTLENQVQMNDEIMLHFPSPSMSASTAKREPDLVKRKSFAPGTITSVSQVEIGTLIEKDQLAVLSADEAKVNCFFCENRWDDTKASVKYRFTQTDAVVHHECLQYAVKYLTTHAHSVSDPATIHLVQTKPLVNQAGIFHITAKRAVDLPTVQFIGTQDPFVKVTLRPWAEMQQSKPADHGGKNPNWQQLENSENVFELVHPYNSASTPVPQVKLELWNSNFFTDDFIASTILDVVPLMKHPNIEAERWFTLDKLENTGVAVKSKPRILLQMRFETKTETEDKKAHKFRAHSVKTIKATGIKLLECAVCQAVIVMAMKGGGFRCEVCDLDVHHACMLIANAKFPCKKTLLSQDGPRKSIVKAPAGNRKRLGSISMKFYGLHICTAGCSDGKHAENIYEGDTYCRISFDGQQYETVEVLKSADPVFNEECELDVYDRSSIFRLDAIDLRTNAIVGSMQISLFQLLQRDADELIEHLRQQTPFQPLYDTERDPSGKVEYPLLSSRSTTAVGKVYIELLYFEEKRKLFQPPPRLPDREEKELSTKTLKTNFERMHRLRNELLDLEKEYMDLIGWKSKFRSSVALTLFVYLCLYYDTEYLPALFFISLAIHMVAKFVERLDRRYVRCWVERDTAEDLAEKEIRYRPVAKLRLAPIDLELTLPSKQPDPIPSVHVVMKYYPNDGKSYEHDVEFTPSGQDEYIIGRTPSVTRKHITSWRSGEQDGPSIFPSMTKTSDAILQNVQISWPHDPQVCSCSECKEATLKISGQGGSDLHALQYPLLQPTSILSENRREFVPWYRFPGVVQFDVMYSLKGDTTEAIRLGFATVNISDLVSSNRGLEKEVKLKVESIEANAGLPAQLRVRMQLELPAPSTNTTPIHRIDRHYTLFLENTLKSTKAGINIGAGIWEFMSKAQAISQSVQNELGRIAGATECITNLFNWTHPIKTSMVFSIVVFFAIVCSYIPSRYLLLGIGMSEFGAALQKYKPPSSRLKQIFWNYIASLPTEEDLVECYATLYQQHLDKKEKEHERDLHQIQLNKFAATWIGTLLSKLENERAYRSVFCVYRSDRLVFWKSQEDAVTGGIPMAELVLPPNAKPEMTSSSLRRGARSHEFALVGINHVGVEEKRWFEVDVAEKRNLYSILVLERYGEPLSPCLSPHKR